MIQPRALALLPALLLSCGDYESHQAPCSELPKIGVTDISLWLSRTCYSNWPSESGVLQATRSDGLAQIFINPILAESMQNHGTSHPVNAAAVRVMYTPDGQTLRGYAMAIKTSRDGTPGWYWHEELLHQEAPRTSKVLAPGCTTCHAEGNDFVQSTWPLR